MRKWGKVWDQIDCDRNNEKIPRWFGRTVDNCLGGRDVGDWIYCGTRTVPDIGRQEHGWFAGGQVILGDGLYGHDMRCLSAGL